MKKRFIASLVSLLSLVSSASFAESGSRPVTKIIKPISLVAEVMNIESPHTALIVTPVGDDVDALILKEEINPINYGTKKVNGKLNYVLRVGMYGLSSETDIDVIREVIEGNTYSMNCQSVLFDERMPKIPLCQILIDDSDIFLMMARHKKFEDKIKLSTRYIHFDLEMREDYEKVIGSLILRGF
jgi:hypothetical protein